MFPALRSIGKILCAAWIMLMWGCASQACAHHELTKLAPDPVTIYLENGIGRLEIIFSLKFCDKLPQFEITDAVGRTSSIPKSDIKFSWGDTRPDQKTIRVASIDIKTDAFVEANIEYKGQIIFLWSDSRRPETDVINFSVVDRSSVAFELSPQNSDVAIGPGESYSITLRIKNTGNAKISKLTISSLEMADAATQHRAALPVIEINIDVSPAKEEKITVPLPKPLMAGTYSGGLDVVANERTRQSIPLTVRTRGPNYIPLISRIDGFSYLPGLPFILFLAVLALTFWLSTKLDRWFGLGGLQRAQSEISLRKSRRAIEQALQRIKEWQTQHPGINLKSTESRLQLALTDLNGVLANLEDSPPDQLSKKAQEFETQADFAEIFQTRAEEAIRLWRGEPTKLKGVLEDMDKIIPSDAKTYREELESVLANAVRGVAKAAAATKAKTSAPPEEAKARKKIKTMNLLHHSIIWVVVFVIAYQTFYATNLAFGAALDYVSVFLWTLGLTQTGTQIIATIRASRAKSSES